MTTTVGDLITKLGDAEAQVRTLRAAVVSASETADKALERLQRAEEIIERVRGIAMPIAGCSHEGLRAVGKRLKELLNIYDEHKPS